jgi:hypothetical protein
MSDIGSDRETERESERETERERDRERETDFSFYRATKCLNQKPYSKQTPNSKS